MVLFSKKVHSVVAFILLLILPVFSFAQFKYWIFLKENRIIKPGQNYVSPETIRNRVLLNIEYKQVTDVPVNKSFIDSLTLYGVKMISQSRWLNAVSARLSLEQIEKLRKLDFIEEIQPIDHELCLASISSDIRLSSFALGQTHSKIFYDNNLTGKNVAIGVIDGSFHNAGSMSSLRSLFSNKQIIQTRDFTTLNNSEFFYSKNRGNHGAQVLQCIGGFDDEKKEQFGVALASNFYLAKTEIDEKELRLEEDHWISALEWLDSLGVRLVNSSLGYSEGFDNPLENHQKDQMTRKLSPIVKAAEIAVNKKGMILVIAAGNEGNNPNWQIVTTPGDAKSVISVGATDHLGQRNHVSSIGPTFSSYIKPDISCFSVDGTSLSTPVITGMIACMLECNPALQYPQILEILQKASNLYPYCNNYIGYGVPDANKVLALLKGNMLQHSSSIVKVKGAVSRLKSDTENETYVICFNKLNDRIVKEQVYLKLNECWAEVYRPKNVKRSTVVFNNKVVEIIWK